MNNYHAYAQGFNTFHSPEAPSSHFQNPGSAPRLYFAHSSDGLFSSIIIFTIILIVKVSDQLCNVQHALEERFPISLYYDANCIFFRVKSSISVEQPFSVTVECAYNTLTSSTTWTPQSSSWAYSQMVRILIQQSQLK